jgi:hypothetical protein
VRAGAFFSQAELQVPQKEMRQHGREHMLVPARVFAYFIVIHPEFRFAFFKALVVYPNSAANSIRLKTR